jgi:hypothetical protein
MPAHCHDERSPLLAKPEPEKPPEEEPKPIGIKAVAAAVRWHRADLAELMRESDVMVRAMTGRQD